MLWTRLAIAAAQGIALIVLSLLASHENDAKPIVSPLVLAPLIAIFTLVPVLAIQGLGTIRGRTLIAWIGGLVVLLAIVALHSVIRHTTENPSDNLLENAVDNPLVFATLGALFIAQSLVTAGSSAGRFIAPYPAYFDAAWKLAVQAILSCLFVGAFWLLLELGATLFDTVGLSFFNTILKSSVFSVLATTLALATAIYITDVNPSIIRGVRTLKLTLFSWLLPVMTIITLGFLASLTITGLQPIWATHHAAAMFFGACAALIYFINCAYQDGEGEPAPRRFIRITGQLATLAMVPIVILALYGTGLRIYEDGLTADRIMLIAGLLIVTQHVIGYAFAAFDRRSWMKRLEPTNIIGAFLTIILYICFFTPLADPARISVHNQLHRLESGKTNPDSFDYKYLHDEGLSYGEVALEVLRDHGASPVIREKARKALLDSSAITIQDTPEAMAKKFSIAPDSTGIPDDFWKQDWQHYPEDEFVTCESGICHAFLVAVPGETEKSVLLSNAENNAVVLFSKAATGWKIKGSFLPPFCDTSDKSLDFDHMISDGKFDLVPHASIELKIGKFAFPLDYSNSLEGCP